MSVGCLITHLNRMDPSNFNVFVSTQQRTQTLKSCVVKYGTKIYIMKRAYIFVDKICVLNGINFIVWVHTMHIIWSGLTKVHRLAGLAINIAVENPPILRDSYLNNYKSSKIPYLNYFCARKSLIFCTRHTLTTVTSLRKMTYTMHN